MVSHKTKNLVLIVTGALLVGFSVNTLTTNTNTNTTTTYTAVNNVADTPNLKEKIIVEKYVPIETKNVTSFYGDKQAGVDTPQNLFQTFLGYDLTRKEPELAKAALIIVTDDAARLTQGEPALGDMEPEIAKEPANLTVTVGLGENFYKIIKTPKPKQLIKLPEFSTDKLDDNWRQTDFMLQVSSNDPLTLSHTIRMLNKDLKGVADLQWIQEGYIPLAKALENSEAHRNLMGQVDGTVNPKVNTDEFNKMVWIQNDNVNENDGTVLVLRRIKLLMDEWDLLDPSAQESSIGRQRGNGAPLGGENEAEELPLDKVETNGLPTIPLDAHARVARGDSEGATIFRRPYNYDAGLVNGHIEFGQLFAMYGADLEEAFIPMQTRIAESDAFNEWNETIGSSVYFILPGVSQGEFIGERLFK